MSRYKNTSRIKGKEEEYYLMIGYNFIQDDFLIKQEGVHSVTTVQLTHCHLTLNMFQLHP